jgi:hypothetical protein
MSKGRKHIQGSLQLEKYLVTKGRNTFSGVVLDDCTDLARQNCVVWLGLDRLLIH